MPEPSIRSRGAGTSAGTAAAAVASARGLLKSAPTRIKLSMGARRPAASGPGATQVRAEGAATQVRAEGAATQVRVGGGCITGEARWGHALAA
jgi:hypothetical protein